MKKKIPLDDYKPKTHSIFRSLSSAPKWAEKLLGRGKDYDEFLRWLLENGFFEERNEKTTVKWMADQFESKPALVTKWIEMIYEDIFDLNEEQPELFQSKGYMHTLSFHYSCRKFARL